MMSRPQRIACSDAWYHVIWKDWSKGRFFISCANVSYTNGLKKLLFQGSSCIYPLNHRADQRWLSEYQIKKDYLEIPEQIAKSASVKVS
jgi:hypothetical protein